VLSLLVARQSREQEQQHDTLAHISTSLGRGSLTFSALEDAPDASEWGLSLACPDADVDLMAKPCRPLGVPARFGIGLRQDHHILETRDAAFIIQHPAKGTLTTVPRTARKELPHHYYCLIRSHINGAGGRKQKVLRVLTSEGDAAFVCSP
jgi:hypothetical protein